MRRLGFILAFVLFSCCASANAGVLLFDDLSIGPTLGSYGGFNWDANLYVYDNASYQSGYGNTYTTTSPENFIYNAFGVVSTTSTAGTDFDFNGAYFSTWAANDSFAWHSSNSVTLEGWDDGVLIGSITTALSSTQFNWVAANFASIDELRMINDGSYGRWWIMDNFTFNASVPEPAAVAAWTVLGMVGFGLVRRATRRQR
jgi:hypothetical protein